MGDFAGVAERMELTTELRDAISMDVGEGEEIEITWALFSPTETPPGSVESSWPSTMFWLINERMVSSICCNWRRIFCSWSFGTVAVPGTCLLTLATLGHTYSAKTPNPGTSTISVVASSRTKRFCRKGIRPPHTNCSLPKRLGNKNEREKNSHL